MATPDFEQPTGSAASAPTLPGHTIDVLRAQGNVAEARVEFERLVQEGADSGIDSRQPAAIFDAVRAEIRNRAPISDTAGVSE